MNEAREFIEERDGRRVVVRLVPNGAGGADVIEWDADTGEKLRDDTPWQVYAPPKMRNP